MNSIAGAILIAKTDEEDHTDPDEQLDGLDEEQRRIAAARDGDKDAIAWLVEHYQKPAYWVCYRMLRERTEAEDAAQEALIKAVMNLDTFDITRPFKPWMLRIASNECLDRLRRRKPMVYLDGLGEDGAWEWKPGESPNPEAEFLRREKESQIRALLDVLSPLDRNVVTLFYWEGLSYAEISEATSLSVSAIKSRLFRARRAMAEQLETSAL